LQNKKIVVYLPTFWSEMVEERNEGAETMQLIDFTEYMNAKVGKVGRNMTLKKCKNVAIYFQKWLQFIIFRKRNFEKNIYY
jgi:hypothetical protein